MSSKGSNQARRRLPLRQRAARAVRRVRETTDPLTSWVQPLTRQLTTPVLIVTMIGVFYLVSSHVSDPTKSWVHTLETRLRATKGLEKVADWVKANGMKTVGAVCYTLTTLILAPQRLKATWVAYGLAAAYLIPEPSQYEYVYQCLALALYLRTNSKNLRMVIVVSVAVLYVLGMYVATSST